MPTEMRTDYDGPWKEILDVYFQAFLFLLFPKVAKKVNWERRYRIRNAELQRIAPRSATGRQDLDKLVQVWLKDGTEQWILIHIEIQTWRDDDLPRRVAHYRWALHLKYNVPIASLVVLADDDPGWKVDRYRVKCLGSRDEVYFPVAKLTDFTGKEEELATNSNPFARFILAHLKTRQTTQTTQNPEDRLAWKSRIVQGLFDQKLTAEDVQSMLRFIDWLMVLPPPLIETFKADLREFQKEKEMPFITQTEQSWLDEGRQEGREEARLDAFRETLLLRFGAECEQIDVACGTCSKELLAKLLRAIVTDRSLEEVKAIWLEENQ